MSKILKCTTREYDPTDTVLSHAFNCAKQLFQKYPALTNIELLWQHVRYRRTKWTGETSHWAVTPWPINLPKNELQNLVDLLPVNHIAAIFNTDPQKPPCMKGVGVIFTREGKFRLERWTRH